MISLDEEEAKIFRDYAKDVKGCTFSKLVEFALQKYCHIEDLDKEGYQDTINEKELIRIFRDHFNNKKMLYNVFFSLYNDIKSEVEGNKKVIKSPDSLIESPEVKIYDKDSFIPAIKENLANNRSNTESNKGKDKYESAILEVNELENVRSLYPDLFDPKRYDWLNNYIADYRRINKIKSV